MAQNIAIHSLFTAREAIVAEKKAAISRFDEQIQELETAIERLSGKKVWEIEEEMIYDEALIAFWDGQSRGTKNMIDQAKLLGLKVRIIKYA